MPRTRSSEIRLLAIVAAVAFLASCASTPKVSPEGSTWPIVRGSSGDVVDLIVRSLDPLSAAVTHAARAGNGILASSATPVFVMDLESNGRASRIDAAILPMMTVAADPDAVAFLPSGAAMARALRRGEVVVHAQTAALHALRIGSHVRLAVGRSQRTFRIGYVSPGDGFFRYEFMIPLSAAPPVAPHSMLVAATPARASAVAESVQHSAGEDTIRIEAIGSPKDGATLPSYGKIKQLFGEFWFERGADGVIHPDPAWVRNEIVHQRVAVLGRILCHRKIVHQLSYAMREIQRAGLAGLIRSYDGCYVPRLQRTASVMSSHAWGIAFDINAAWNRQGYPPTMDQRIVGIMKRWGFAWGGRFLIPDGMHFEFARFPSRAQYDAANAHA